MVAVAVVDGVVVVVGVGVVVGVVVAVGVVVGVVVAVAVVVGVVVGVAVAAAVVVGVAVAVAVGVVLMGAYRRVPNLTVRHAVQWTGYNLAELRAWRAQLVMSAQASQTTALDLEGFPPDKLGMYVKKSDARCTLDVGDWIVLEEDGDGLYPCVDEMFRQNYEPLFEHLPLRDEILGDEILLAPYSNRALLNALAERMEQYARPRSTAVAQLGRVCRSSLAVLLSEELDAIRQVD